MFPHKFKRNDSKAHKHTQQSEFCRNTSKCVRVSVDCVCVRACKCSFDICLVPDKSANGSKYCEDKRTKAVEGHKSTHTYIYKYPCVCIY